MDIILLILNTAFFNTLMKWNFLKRRIIYFIQFIILNGYLVTNSKDLNATSPKYSFQLNIQFEVFNLHTQYFL